MSFDRTALLPCSTDLEFVLRNCSIFREFFLPCMWFLSFQASFRLHFHCARRWKLAWNERNHIQGRKNSLNMLQLRSTNYMSGAQWREIGDPMIFFYPLVWSLLLFLSLGSRYRKSQIAPFWVADGGECSKKFAASCKCQAMSAFFAILYSAVHMYF